MEYPNYSLTEKMKKEGIVGVAALIIDKDRILLGYRTDKCKFYPNCWFLPCGRTKKGESPKDAIIREVKEETSLDVKTIKEIFNKLNKRGIPEIVYLCKVMAGNPKNIEPDKCKELAYFPLNKLPKNTGKKTLEIVAEYKNF